MNVLVSGFKNNQLKFYFHISQGKKYIIVNQILENYEDYRSFVGVSLESMKDRDDYIAYLIFEQILSIKEEKIDELNDEDREKVEYLISQADKHKLVSKSNLIKYLNINYKEIYQIAIDNIENINLYVIAQCSTGICDDLKSYLIQNYPIHLIYDFEKFEKWFIKELKLLPQLLNVSNLSGNYWTNFSDCLSILKSLSKRKSNEILEITKEIIQQIFDFLIDYFVNKIEKQIWTSEDNRDLLIFDKVYSDFQSFLVNIKSPLANEFKSIHSQMEQKMNSYLEEYGQLVSFEIANSKQLEEVLQEFKSFGGDVIKLTHGVDVVDDVEVSYSRIGILNPKEKGLIDIVSHNVETNNYFTFTFQRKLDSTILLFSLFVKEIILDTEGLTKLQQLIYYRIQFVSKTLELDEDVLEVTQLLIDSIHMMSTYKDSHERFLCIHCYNVSVLGFIVIEKLLKGLYFNLVKSEKYVSSSKMTLGPLLASEELREFFGESYLKNLTYFLSTSDEEKIGHDYRNRFAHYSNISEDMLTIEFSSRIIYLFLDIFNTIFLHCLHE